MRSLASRLDRIEKQSGRRDAGARGRNYILSHRLCALLVQEEPGLARVRPEHTDSETYRHIAETLAWARGDFHEAERLADLNPNKPVAAPPGTPWEERMRIARVAFDAVLLQVEEQSERVQAAVRAATG